MQYISSDTNVWIDFATIDRIEYPFRLPYTYLMFREAIEDEFLSPDTKQAVSLGLVATELSYDEFLLADQYGSTYKKLSVYDRIALAIAKKRSITLLTGDAALRKAAQKENVKIIGTLGILDELLASKLIAESDYKYCLEELDRYNGGVIRLPKDEIIKRIQQIESI